VRSENKRMERIRDSIRKSIKGNKHRFNIRIRTQHRIERQYTAGSLEVTNNAGIHVPTIAVIVESTNGDAC
jgi:hypothetical protein